MYNIIINCDKYNIDVKGTVNITVKCLDFNGKSVMGKDIELVYDNSEVIYTGVTNAKGECKVEYICNQFGTHRLSVETAVAYINVGNPYPVGAIYISYNEVNPATLFGGRWIKIEDRFLLASGRRAVQYTDGEETHTLTINEMPKHNHTQGPHRHRQQAKYSSGSGSGSAYVQTANRKTVDHYTDNTTPPAVNNTGGGQAHNNMPPYLVVSIWRREQ